MLEHTKTSKYQDSAGGPDSVWLFVANNVAGGNDFENRARSKKHCAVAVCATCKIIFEVAPYVRLQPCVVSSSSLTIGYPYAAL